MPKKAEAQQPAKKVDVKAAWPASHVLSKISKTPGNVPGFFFAGYSARKPARVMFANAPKLTCKRRRSLSAFGRIADIKVRGRHDRFWQILK